MTTPNYKKIIYLSFLSFTFGKFVNPEDVVKGETYVLTLSTDSSKMLDSKSGRLFSEVFKHSIEDAVDVGSDTGRRWQFCDGIPPEGGSVYSVGGRGDGGYLYYDYIGVIPSGPPRLLTTGKRTANLVTAHRYGTGIKLKYPPQEGSDKVWIPVELGRGGDTAGVWMITKTTPRDGWEAKCQ